jgi:hypothetical protein
VRPIAAPHRVPGLPRLRALQGRITLLNGWHRAARAERIGTCSTCQQDIKADHRAVHLHGELYHSDCAL